MTVVLGVDGGGTSTNALIADDRGDLRGFGVSGPSNWEDIGFEAAISSVGIAVREAVAMAGAQRRYGPRAHARQAR